MKNIFKTEYIILSNLYNFCNYDYLITIITYLF